MKTFKTLSLIGILLVGFLMGNAQEKSEVRTVASFSKIAVNQGINVELTLGQTQYVEVICDADYIDQIVTEVSNDELKIHIKGNNWRGKVKNITVKVTATKMESIDASSGASIVTQNLISSEELKMSVSSGATIKIAFKAPNAS